jgi:hypothetical protein
MLGEMCFSLLSAMMLRGEMTTSILSVYTVLKACRNLFIYVPDYVVTEEDTIDESGPGSFRFVHLSVKRYCRTDRWHKCFRTGP